MKKILLSITAALLLSGCFFQPDKHSPIKIISIQKSNKPQNGLYKYHAIDTKRHGGFNFWSDDVYWIGDSLRISKF